MQNQYKPFTQIDLIAFDADDTLWDCQGHFNKVEEEYCNILSAYGSSDYVSKRLFETETGNMPLLGYGSKAFTISLVENAINISGRTIPEDKIIDIINLGKTLLQLPATPLEGVVETLKAIRQKSKYKMVVFTKGDNLDQENKFHRSGLAPYFDDIVVVADKTKREYQRLCGLFDTDISRMCMVGNSFKSDIKPVLQIGGYAVHVPYPLMWKLEETEETCSPHLRKVDSFRELANLF